MPVKKTLYIIILAIFLWSCSSPAVKDSPDVSGPTPPLPEKSAPDNLSNRLSDRELFEEALTFLRNDENEPNYKEAKIRLEQLTLQYPKSKWVPGAQALIKSLETISALQTKLKQERQKAQGDHAKLTRDIDGLKSVLRQAEEKHAAGIAELQQENEQLKNDIQQLKKLEVQLEKREKMLR